MPADKQYDSMLEFKKSFIGGMRAETFNATFPFAKLTVYSSKIILSILGIKKYIFNEQEVIGFKTRMGGFQIFHNKPTYPTFIIFWGNSRRIAKAVQESGFTPEADGKIDDAEYQQHTYLGITMLVLIFLFIGIFFLIDFLSK